MLDLKCRPDWSAYSGICSLTCAVSEQQAISSSDFVLPRRPIINTVQAKFGLCPRVWHQGFRSSKGGRVSKNSHQFFNPTQPQCNLLSFFFSFEKFLLISPHQTRSRRGESAIEKHKIPFSLHLFHHLKRKLCAVKGQKQKKLSLFCWKQ